MGFKESLESGCIGEAVAWNFFESLPDVRSVIDVRQDKNFQGWDVDFLIENNNRQFSWVEIKTDYQSHETGNFVYEVTTSGNIGCFEKTMAQIIAYYVPQSGHMYLISVNKLKEFAQGSKFRQIPMGDNATGYLLPISELERHGIIYGMYNVEKVIK